MVTVAEIKEHMEVKDSAGVHVGVVDGMEGADKIKLTKNDPTLHAHHHHYIPLSWVARIHEGHIHLSKTADDAKAHWEHGAK